MNLRLALLPVHRWTGLTLGLIVLISALTGAGMAFRNELDPVVYPRLFHASACPEVLPLDTFVAAARGAHPQDRVDYVRVRGAADAPVAVRFFNKDTLYLDRCTGAVVGDQNRYQGVFGQLERIHRMAFVKSGGWIMGAGALNILTILGGVGTYLWWPRKPRRFSQGFQVDRRLKGRMFTLGLHRTVGAWAGTFLILSALTGLPNAFDGVKAAITAIGDHGGETRPRSQPPADRTAQRLPLQATWSTINRLSPHPQEVLIHLAKHRADPIEAYIIDADAPHANARTYLFLDAWSGRVLRYTPYRQSTLGARIYFWMLSIHTGQVGGVFGQFLLFAGAVSVPVLAYTGLSSYLRRRFAKPSRRRTRTSGEAIRLQP